MCSICYGYGFWAWGPIQPIGPVDASDGMPTIKCPECGADANPLNTSEATQRHQIIKKLYENPKQENKE